MTHNGNKSALAVALVSIGFSFGAFAQGSTGTSSSSGGDTKSQQSTSSKSGGSSASKSGSSSVSSGERKFVEQAAIDGMAEVELGKLASTKASNSQVKQFAQRM